jgi:hypothetical protein
MVERGELLGRVIVAVEQRGHQDLNRAGGQRIKRTGIAVVGKPAGRLSFSVRDERRVVAARKSRTTDQVSSATPVELARLERAQNAG